MAGSLKVAIVSDETSWIGSYVEELRRRLVAAGNSVMCSHSYAGIEGYDVVFILSYSRIIKYDALKKNRHNIVVHESDLPKGKGWSPLTWQILEGKSSIPITLFEASEQVDSGKIYLQEVMRFTGNELVDDLREIQGKTTIELCERFISDYDTVVQNAREQEGMESFYPRRTPKDSIIDENLSLREQFNLLRVADNKRYPAFFFHNGYKYILQIYREDN